MYPVHSFNGVKPSFSWRLSKVIEVFEETFEANGLEYRFGGTGASRGINFITSMYRDSLDNTDFGESKILC